jgi:hypothetical protein
VTYEHGVQVDYHGSLGEVIITGTGVSGSQRAKMKKTWIKENCGGHSDVYLVRRQIGTWEMSIDQG